MNAAKWKIGIFSLSSFFFLYFSEVQLVQLDGCAFQCEMMLILLGLLLRRRRNFLLLIHKSQMEKFQLLMFAAR